MDARPQYTSAPSSTSSTQQRASPSQGYMAPSPRREAKEASTDVFLRDLNLVAEAAKRAQMACLMRDMESIGLS